MDIGTARGEIDYVASNRGIDPRGIPIRRMNIRYLATVDGPKWTRSDAPQRPTGSKGGVAERRETFWRPRDLVHILYLQMP